MASILNEVAIILFLILLNGILAMSELALVSARKARLHHFVEEGDKAAETALRIAQSPNDFLSTVQIGITLVGIFAGAFGGFTIAEHLAGWLQRYESIRPFAQAIAMGIVVTAITYCSLIFGELVPKRIALHSPERIARFMAPPMEILSHVAKPMVVLLSASTDFVLKVFRLQESREPAITEAELKVIVEQAAEAGVVEHSEEEMMHSILGLGDRKAISLMIPRNDVISLRSDASEEEILELVDQSSHSRFPVIEGSLDHILGIVESKSIIRCKLHDMPLDLSSLIIEAAYVPENITALELLEQFRVKRQHMVVLLDEYGGFQGIVTRDDLFASIVGELPRDDQSPRWQVHQREDGSWLIDGQMPIAAFMELFNGACLSQEPGDDYHTVAGFILSELSHVPEEGEHFEVAGLRFEVVDMDRHRIDKVLVQKLND